MQMIIGKRRAEQEKERRKRELSLSCSHSESLFTFPLFLDLRVSFARSPSLSFSLHKLASAMSKFGKSALNSFQKRSVSNNTTSFVLSCSSSSPNWRHHSQQWDDNRKGGSGNDHNSSIKEEIDKKEKLKRRNEWFGNYDNDRVKTQTTNRLTHYTYLAYAGEGENNINSSPRLPSQ